jgi:hypothetical protein
MRIRSHKSTRLCLIIAATIALNSSHSTAVLSSAPTIDAWTTQRFGKSDLPCLPLQKDKAFTIEQRTSTDNAYMMMAASYLAYSFWPGKRKRILTSWGFSNIQLFDDSQSSTNGYWAEHKNFVLLAFRGTQEPTDLITDISVNLERFEHTATDTLVHTGFKRGADAVWPHVESAGNYARKVEKPLLVTGHSLGGAIALLSAVRLEKNDMPVHTLWTFGAPKVGNNSFFDSTRSVLQDRWQRINHHSDPIPALPFTLEDEDRLRRWAIRWGKFMPIMQRFAENSNYDTAPIVFKDNLPDLTRTPITRRKFSEIGLGFLKHLPRSYVCDLSKDKIQL